MRLGAIHSTKVIKKIESCKSNFPNYVLFGATLCLNVLKSCLSCLKKLRIIEGQFKGVMGRVARISGQQRVVVEVKDVCLVSTAYIPSAFLEVVKAEE
jgi:hypothetical protein